MKKLLALMLLVCGAAFAASSRSGQVSVGTSTPAAIGNTASRVSLTIINTDAANPVYCGTSSTVSSSTGLKIPFGYAYTWDGGPASFYNQPVASQIMYCIATGSSVTVAFLENSSQ